MSEPSPNVVAQRPRRLRSRAVVRAGQAYRALMINLDDLASTLAGIGPASRILEIKNVRFMRGQEFRTLVQTALPGFDPAMTHRLAPHRQNLLLALRTPALLPAG